MRIALLTYHWVCNFGANLQVLATSRYLEELGHQVWVLNYRPEDLEQLYSRRVGQAQANAHERFLEDYLEQSPVCRSAAELAAFAKKMEFDAVIVGSDAVFRLSSNLDREDTRFPNPFWLTWVDSDPQRRPIKAALAASAMGTNYYSYPLLVRRGISNALRSTDHLSVRDRWTRVMLTAVTWGRCRPGLCPDPVVVLNEALPEQDACQPSPSAEPGRYILMSVYQGMLSDQWIGEFTGLAHENHLEVFSIPFPERELDLPVDRIIRLPLSPLQWYSWIRNAAGFVGVRMHPVLCSMVNEVPFLSFDTYQHGRFRMSSKTFDLCARAGVGSLCLDNDQRRSLSPRQVVEMLASGEQDRAKQYVSEAKCAFSRTVEKILVR